MSKESTLTPCQVLLPVSLIAFVVALSLAFQTTQIVRDHDFLQTAKSQQDKPLEETAKVQAQLTALAFGTKKLADGGDKDAQAIVTRMKQAGISIGGEAAATGAQPAAPAAPAAK